jgi:hypothetical protein
VNSHFILSQEKPESTGHISGLPTGTRDVINWNTQTEKALLAQTPFPFCRIF